MTVPGATVSVVIPRPDRGHWPDPLSDQALLKGFVRREVETLVEKYRQEPATLMTVDMVVHELNCLIEDLYGAGYIANKPVPDIRVDWFRNHPILYAEFSQEFIIR